MLHLEGPAVLIFALKMTCRSVAQVHLLVRGSKMRASGAMQDRATNHDRIQVSAYMCQFFHLYIQYLALLHMVPQQHTGARLCCEEKAIHSLKKVTKGGLFTGSVPCRCTSTRVWRTQTAMPRATSPPSVWWTQSQVRPPHIIFLTSTFLLDCSTFPLV